MLFFVLVIVADFDIFIYGILFSMIKYENEYIDVRNQASIVLYRAILSYRDCDSPTIGK